VFIDPGLRRDDIQPYFAISYPIGNAASVNHSQIEWAKVRIA
jgi:hypothetical protein